MSDVPANLYQLRKIPDEHIADGRHANADCSGEHGEQRCREPLQWCMTIEEWPEGEGNYNTAYWCDKHKPQEQKS